MMMHPGMEGQHDFRILLPATSGDSTDVLEMDLRGDFR